MTTPFLARLHPGPRKTVPAPSVLARWPGDVALVDNASVRVLVADANPSWRASMQSFLEHQQLSVTSVGDGPAAVDRFLAEPPDLVLLAIDLPGLSGTDVCRRIRAKDDKPVVAVAERTNEIDRVLAFECGADDCVDYDTTPRELLARIRAHVRRARGCLSPSAEPVQVGALRLDRRSMLATLDGRQLQLTSYEFGLLHGLAERAGQVLTREQLLELVRGRNDDAFDRSVDVHISRLRQKLGDNPRSPRLLKTVRGAGYLISIPEQPEPPARA